MPLKCVTLPLAASTFTHIRHHALKACAEEKWSFCICGCCYLFKQQQREQCDVSNHICYASRSILPTRRASREVSGTVEQQPSLECKCHYGINSEPWLMFCICSHPSQHCHRSGQRTWVPSWMVWTDLVLGTRGVTTSRVFEGPQSLFFGCALIFLNVQRSDVNWCVFWRPAALSTAMPPVCTGTMQAECPRATEREGRVASKGGSLHPVL